ncbi:hypothetical protein CPB84DRAFT_1787560, partial [Gymnopilus junonius]
MGKGIFATRDIKAGELIFSERPLLVGPSTIEVGALRYPVGERELRSLHALMIQEWEQRLELTLMRMDKEDEEAYKALRNSHTEDGSGPLLGIFRTNGFEMGLYDKEQRIDVITYSAILKIGSRINHSCIQNVIYKFDIPSLSFRFHAVLPIKAGEQLFFHFCKTGQSKAERAAELAPYGIVCNCPACENATPETDKLRKEYKKLTREYTKKIRQWLSLETDGSQASGSSHKINENQLEPILRFTDALAQEGLPIEFLEAYGELQGVEEALRF